MSSSKSTKSGFSITKIAGWISSITIIFGALVWALSDNVESYIISVVAKSDPTVSECIVFQDYGNRVSPAKPGEWTDVTWTNLRKLKNCGPSRIQVSMYDSEGMLFTPEVSATQVNLEVGMMDKIAFRFKIPEDAKPGRAEVFMTVKYENEDTPMNSPHIFFYILPENEEPVEEDNEEAIRREEDDERQFWGQ